MGYKITISRNILTPGHPDRDWLHVWSVDVPFGSDETWQFPRATLKRGNLTIPLKQFHYRPYAWHEPFNSAFRLLETATPGDYTLYVNDINCGDVQATTPYGQSSLNNVDLPSGLYRPPANWNLPASTRLVGNNTRVVIEPKAKYYDGVTDNVFQSIGANCEIRGVDFVFPNGFCPSPVQNLVIKDCTIRSNSWRLDGQLGNSAGGWMVLQGMNNLVKDCVFKKGGRAGGDGTAYVGCEWYGLPDANCHSFQCDGNKAPLMLMDCLFDGTDRGPVIRPISRDVTEVFVSTMRYRNINEQYNGCEVVCGEGQFKMRRSIFNNWRFTNCGSILMLGAPTSDCRVHGLVGDGIDIIFQDGFDHSGNIVSNSEFRNGMIYLGDGARNNRIFYNGFLGWQLKTQNQFSMMPNEEYATQERKYKAAIVEMVPGANNIENNTYRLPAGVPDVLRPVR